MKRIIWIVGVGLAALLLLSGGTATYRVLHADRVGTTPSELDQNAFYISIFVVLFVITGTIVWFLAGLLRWRWPRLSLPLSLAVSHTILLLICVALCPTGIFFGEPPVDDLYLGYYLFPGVHLYFVAGKIIEPLEPLVGRLLPDFWGSILYLVILPGFVCAVLGGAQWYLIGKLVERVRASRLRRNAQAA